MSVSAALRVSLAAILLGSAAAPAGAQQAYAYPNAGQTEAQQSKDRFECHQWAVTQSGFDPSTAPPLTTQPAAMPPPPDPRAGYSDQRQSSGSSVLGIGNGGFFQGGGMMGDAATGAALGAAGGAIAGDAGQGAAIGAVASTLFGALSRSSQPAAPPPQQQANTDYYYQQQQAQANQEYQQRLNLQTEYNRAFGACMSARSYTVQ